MNNCFENLMKGAYEKLKQYYVSAGIPVNSDGTIDIDCSYDGTWMTRGYKSLIGVGFVVDVNTGVVVDFEVVSSFCKACSTMRKKLGDKFDE